MKKIYSIFALLAYSSSTFAYSSHDDGLSTFLGIVSFIFGVLSLILFFKIWGMTRNVKEILKRLDDEQKKKPVSTTKVISQNNDSQKSRKYFYLKVLKGEKTDAIKELKDLTWADVVAALDDIDVYVRYDKFYIRHVSDGTAEIRKNTDEVCLFVQKRLINQVLKHYSPMYEILSEKVPESLTDFDYHQYRKAIGLKSLKKMQGEITNTEQGVELDSQIY